MTEIKLLKPDYLFEISWEVCNKVGGVYTVISTKAPFFQSQYKDNYLLIGPDVWKETNQNPYFIEDKQLYSAWREYAESRGLRIRLGRWNIDSGPVVVLIDFTTFFQYKDKIFAELWESYKLDSIAGQWDYIEPALFGYAAGRVIESFYEFGLSSYDRIIAHFHEWMTGAGVLYLKENAPQVATVFTTHATTVGRSVSSNNMPLYSDLSKYNAEELARRFNITSRFSLEKLSSNNCDVFTTVSEITSKECAYLLDRKPDFITPNGFDSALVPDKNKIEDSKKIAKNKLLHIARALFNIDLPNDTLLVLNSGRYEFRNKGIDLYIEALSKLNNSENFNKTLVAFIMVPANHIGVSTQLLERLNQPDFNNPISNEYLTHLLYDINYDPIINKAKEVGLNNLKEDKVKLIFVPAYLDGNDGIFNFEYYKLLMGFDLTVFPSYYEPWGYTPLESLSFHVPTITTSLAGFGLWIKNKYPNTGRGAWVLPYNDENRNEIVDNIYDIMLDYLNLDSKVLKEGEDKAFEISKIAQWSKLYGNYCLAYDKALDYASYREDQYKNKRLPDTLMSFSAQKHTTPIWSKVFVKTAFPDRFKGLKRLSRNLWWTWNNDAKELFEMMSPKLWKELRNNPMALLEALSNSDIKQLEQNGAFMQKYDDVYKEFENYMKKSVDKPSEMIAYFSMEYGLHDTVQIFSGGLGMLAGDYLKEASDSNYNLVGVGLLYRYGYFKQSITAIGDQVSNLYPQKFTHMPLKPVRNIAGDWITVKIALPGRNLYAKVWRIDVGRIPLYLLDTDINENNEQDRVVTSQLYGGTWENRFIQELLLGVGGIRLLNAVGLKPNIYHCNEGHAAFTALERLREYVQDERFAFDEALEIVRSTSLFTTHTPVPAGHDAFNEDLLRTYIPHYADRLKLSWDEFMNLGRYVENKHDEKFSMSVLALKTSQEMNGVSKIHGDVTRKMFKGMFEGYFAEELYIDYVTNGVHLPTWTAGNWKQIYTKYLDKNYINKQRDNDVWSKIYQVSDDIIWETCQKQRKLLISYIKERLKSDFMRRNESPKLMHSTVEKLNDNILTIGFARRFATYKRAHLLFSNLEKLDNIVNSKEKPVQFIFAGKAHPADKAGQDLIKLIIEISKKPQFIGKIVFIENYDIELGAHLVQGVDIWLNTPTRPLEASGTSGEKAVMNGVLNFSVLDGWWAEGYKQNAGWSLQQERVYENQQFQDELDAENIYSIIEDQITYDFYNRNENGIPVKWVEYIKNTINLIAPNFTMRRMLEDYNSKFYTKLLNRSTEFKQNNYEKLYELVKWKRKISKEWENIEVVSVRIPNSTVTPLILGENFAAEVVLNVNNLSASDIGLEIIFGHKINDEVKFIDFMEELNVVGVDGQYVTYFIEIPTSNAGVIDFAFRMFPKNNLLPHRQDLNLIKWIS